MVAAARSRAMAAPPTRPISSVTVTNRFEQPAAGATLSVGDLNFYSFARGGTGAVAGQAIALGGPQLLVQNSRASFGSYRATSTAGDAIEPTSLADPIRILNGSVTVERDFLVATDNRMSVLIDAGALTAGSVTLDAFTFERDTTVPAVTTLGTIGGGAIAVVSGRDIVLDANLSSTGALTLQAPGSVAVGGLSAIGTTGDILVTGTNVTTGAINAGGSVLVNAGGAIATGTITARRADLAALGAIGVGDVTTSEGFDAEAGGALAVGNVVAGEHIALAAQGAVRAGNLSAGLANAAVREGADYHIGILSGAAVAVGNAAARDWIGIGARGSLSAGTIGSGNDVLLAADGAVATGAITTGAQNRLLIAGADMVALGGPTETFDREPRLRRAGHARRSGDARRGDDRWRRERGTDRRARRGRSHDRRAQRGRARHQPAHGGRAGDGANQCADRRRPQCDRRDDHRDHCQPGRRNSCHRRQRHHDRRACRRGRHLRRRGGPADAERQCRRTCDLRVGRHRHCRRRAGRRGPADCPQCARHVRWRRDRRGQWISPEQCRIWPLWGRRDHRRHGARRGIDDDDRRPGCRQRRGFAIWLPGRRRRKRRRRDPDRRRRALRWRRRGHRGRFRGRPLRARIRRPGRWR